jgi:hypothetical protein
MEFCPCLKINAPLLKKNNKDLFAIGLILGTTAENTWWLACQPNCNQS